MSCSRFDRLGLALLPLALLALALLYAVYVARMPHLDWNAVRVLPSVALIRGWTLYFAPGEGPMTLGHYGPVKDLLYLPAGLASTPTGALAIGGTLNVLVILVPLWLMVSSAAAAGAPWPPRRLAGSVLAAAALLLVEPTRAIVARLHVDAPAVGLGLAACWALAGGGAPPRRRRLAAAAVLGVLAAWTKQVEAPLPLALIVYAALWGRRTAVTFLVYLAVAGAAVSLAFFAVFGFEEMWFNMIMRPARQPYVGGGGWGMFGWSLIAAADVFIHSSPFLLLVLLAVRARGWAPARLAAWLREAPWTIYLLAGFAVLPTSAVGRIIIGGKVNSFHAVAYFAAAAVTVVVRGELTPSRPLLGARLLHWGAVLAVAAAMPQLGVPRELWTWRDNPQEQAYRYARAHPGTSYFPWNTLSTLLAEGRLYHFDYSVFDRGLAGYPLSDAHFRRYVPASPRYVIYHRNAQNKHVLRYFPEHVVEAHLEDLPGWTAYSRPDPPAADSWQGDVEGRAVEVREDAAVVAPVALHAHVEVEEDLLAQVLFEVAPGRGADGLDLAPAAADEDLLLPVALDDHRGVDADKLGQLLVLVDKDGGGEGQLLAGVLEHLLADALGRQEPLGVDGHELRVVDRLARRQQLPQRRQHPLDAVAGRRADGDDLVEGAAIGVGGDPRQQRGLGDQVDLVEDDDLARRRLADPLAHEGVAGAGLLGDVDQQHHQVGLGERDLRRLDHAPVHAVLRAVDAGGVVEDDLAPRLAQDADDALAGGLGLVGDDRHLLRQQPVHQRRLAGVGTAHQGHRAGLVRFFSPLLLKEGKGVRVLHAVSSRGARITSTWITRRSSASSILNDRPWDSITSPGFGT
jgi:hypothetical protein